MEFRIVELTEDQAMALIFGGSVKCDKHEGCLRHQQRLVSEHIAEGEELGAKMRESLQELDASLVERRAELRRIDDKIRTLAEEDDGDEDADDVGEAEDTAEQLREEEAEGYPDVTPDGVSMAYPGRAGG